MLVTDDAQLCGLLVTANEQAAAPLGTSLGLALRARLIDEHPGGEAASERFDAGRMSSLNWEVRHIAPPN